MAPILAKADVRDLSHRHAEACAQLTEQPSALTQATYRLNVGLVEDGEMVVLTASSCRASLLGHVAHVVGMRSDEQMIGVEARRIVAVVQDVQTGRGIEPEPQHRGYAVDGRALVPWCERVVDRSASGVDRAARPDPAAVLVDPSLGEHSLLEDLAAQLLAHLTPLSTTVAARRLAAAPDALGAVASLDSASGAF